MVENWNIRGVTPDDLDVILAWRNHPSVRNFMLTRHEISVDEHRKWFERVSADESHRALIFQEGEQALGYVQFSGVGRGGISNWGFYTRPDAPKGTGSSLGAAALVYAFDTFDLHKVCGQAIATNQASIALHNRLGFTQEGFLRDQHLIEDAYHSLACFGLLKSEWAHLRSNGEQS